MMAAAVLVGALGATFEPTSAAGIISLVTGTLGAGFLTARTIFVAGSRKFRKKLTHLMDTVSMSVEKTAVKAPPAPALPSPGNRRFSGRAFGLTLAPICPLPHFILLSTNTQEVLMSSSPRTVLAMWLLPPPFPLGLSGCRARPFPWTIPKPIEVTIPMTISERSSRIPTGGWRSWKAPELATWVEAQNELAMPFLEGMPGRGEIQARLTELWNYERFGIPSKEGGLYFYTRNDGLQDQDILYVAESLNADPKVLIDPNSFSDDATIALAGTSVSPDGRYIAYATSDGGTDWNTWHVRDVATGEDLPDAISFTKFTGASWVPNGSGFFYSRYPIGPDGEGDGQAQVEIYFHSLLALLRKRTSWSMR